MISESALLILELAGIAFIFAGLPLLYLLRKKGMDVFQKLNWAVVFLTFDLILFGAFTRLSDSGPVTSSDFTVSISCNTYDAP